MAEATFTAEMQQQAAQTLLATVGHPEAQAEENASATDNAVSAIGKLCKRSETIAAAALTLPALATFSSVPLSALRSDALTALDLSASGLGLAEGLLLATLLPAATKLEAVHSTRLRSRTGCCSRRGATAWSKFGTIG